MPWEREAFAKVTISPKQLDEAFMGGCQSILDAKLEGYSEEQVKKILDEKGALEVLNMAAKDLDKYFNPPPPKVKKVAKEAGDAPAKKAPAVPKKAPIKAKEGGDAPAAMKPPAADGDAPAKKAVPKKAPPKKEEKHPYYAWANSPEAGYNTKAPAAYYKEKSQYDLGWFGKYDDSKTEAERSARFLARHDGVGGESYQTRTKERVYKEIAALKEERQARARRARERRGW